MLNYIWLGLLFLGIGTAFTLDITNQTGNKYRNGESISSFVSFDSAYTGSRNQFDAVINISSPEFQKFYGTIQKENISQKVKLIYNEKNNGYSAFFITDEKTPPLWREMARVSGKDNDLNGTIFLSNRISKDSYSAALTLEKISFAKMKEVTNAAIDYAGIAVNIAIGLIGIMALWLGIMKIAEQAGLITIIAKSVRPLTKFLFPQIPHDHPAMGSMIMNMSANMLGLGNAATPFGLKAMEELESLNPEKGTATNAMCTFLAVNTAGMTLIPATAIAVRAAAGSNDPTIIIGTSIFGAACATIVGVLSAKILEKFPMSFSDSVSYIKSGWKLIASVLFAAAVIIFLAGTGLLSSLFSGVSFINAETLKSVIQIVSILAIPLIIISFVLFGVFKKVKIYEVFVEGAKEGFNIAVRIIPYLVAMLVAIGIFRSGGAMDFLMIILSPLTNLIGFPAEALPMALMRPLSGSGSLGVMSEVITVHGPDTFIGILVSTIMGSTETTFYVLALYFGSVSIKRTRHAVAVGILADIAGIMGALFIVKLLFG
ncbi:MAG: nucleoside recognition protein [Ignavibacteriae bacterium HGW-Ignavibacteriae-3]|nr:MAG: nucleoside recognition protein [Ignavibacteriae bacterium HGW-Ignavibacteriae-3]